MSAKLVGPLVAFLATGIVMAWSSIVLTMQSMSPEARS